MKTQIILFQIFVALFAFGMPSRHGVISGGGGRSVVCRNQDGSIKSAEVLDLYEARVQYGLPLLMTGVDYRDIYANVLASLGEGRGPNFAHSLLSSAHYIDLQKRILPNGVALHEIDDSKEVLIPNGCKVEQLANYIDASQILFNGEIWNALDETNKAALIAHETIYLYFRDHGAANSIHARKAVGYGFSGVKLEDVAEGVTDSTIQCESTFGGKSIPTKYWVIQTNPDHDIIQFDSLDGILMLTKTFLTVSKGTFTKANGFERYYSNIDHSIIEKSLPVGFHNVTEYKNGAVTTKRLVGQVDQWKEPEIVTKCSSNQTQPNIELKVSAPIVLPTSLNEEQNCSGGIIEGPRVRFNVQLLWTGEGSLLPLVFELQVNDPRLEQAQFKSVISASGSTPSLSYIFGVEGDYLKPDTRTLKELKGNDTLVVPAKITLTGIVRDDFGDDVPFKKTIDATINYVAGSVPPQ